MGMVTKDKPAFAMTGGHIKQIEVPKIEIRDGKLALPTIAVNMHDSAYEAVKEHLQGVNTTKNGPNGVTVYLPYIGFEQIAYDSHVRYRKGDLLTIYGTLKMTNTGKCKMPILWAKDMRFIRSPSSSIKAAEVD
jgi:hypothetical protein